MAGSSRLISYDLGCQLSYVLTLVFNGLCLTKLFYNNYSGKQHQEEHFILRYNSSSRNGEYINMLYIVK